jgi:hypothetical protein
MKSRIIVKANQTIKNLQKMNALRKKSFQVGQKSHSQIRKEIYKLTDQLYKKAPSELARLGFDRINQSLISTYVQADRALAELKKTEITMRTLLRAII